jgi:hypothetical protein
MPAVEWLILWKSLLVEEATWQETEISKFKEKFQNLFLEDNANVRGGDIDSNHVIPE